MALCGLTCLHAVFARCSIRPHDILGVHQFVNTGRTRKMAGSKLLTDPIVRALPAPASGNRITYDGGDPGRRVAGFGIRVTAAGMRAFILTYRINGLQRRYTIGSFPDWSVSQAREAAKGLKRDID